MAEEQQDFAQEPPLTDGEVRLLRLLLQRVGRPDFDFGFCGPRPGDPEDFGPRTVSVSRSPLLTPGDFRAAGVPRPEVPELATFAGWLRNLFRQLLRRLVRAATFGRREQ